MKHLLVNDIAMVSAMENIFTELDEAIEYFFKLVDKSNEGDSFAKKKLGLSLEDMRQATVEEIMEEHERLGSIDWKELDQQQEV